MRARQTRISRDEAHVRPRRQWSAPVVFKVSEAHILGRFRLGLLQIPVEFFDETF